MASFGRIEPFEEGLEPWAQYAERLCHYFLANDIVDGVKKRAVFLTVIGQRTYGLLRSLISPVSLTDRTFEELVQVLGEHFSPAPSVIVERARFNSRVRNSGESVSTYLAELRKFAEHCQFGANLDEMLRDRLVSGIQDSQMQRRLLAESELTFGKAVGLLTAMESATKNAEELTSGTAGEIHQLYKPKQTFIKQGKRRDNKEGTLHAASKKTFETHDRTKGTSRKCYCCGSTSHLAANCVHKSKQCFSCKEFGHLARCCTRVAPQHETRPKRNVCYLTSPTNVEEYDMFSMCSSRSPLPYWRMFTVSGIPLQMQLDTGAAITIISADTYEKYKGNWPELKPTNIKLKTFTGEWIEILGELTVCVQMKQSEQMLPLVVVSGTGPNLCGRNWISAFKLCPDIIAIADSQHEAKPTLEDILRKHEKVFTPELGLLKDRKVHLIKKPDAEPRFLKARSLPYAMRDGVEKELQRLEDAQIIKPVKYSDWATPIVPVWKKNKQSIRICGDFKLTVNKATETEQYPLPKVNDIFAQLNGGQKFSKLDLKDAYNQLELDTESSKLTVINTHKGLFEYQRLPFGVSSAPAVFQREADMLIQGVKQSSAYLDDMIVTGSNDDEHIEHLDTILTRIEDAGLRLKREKCEFMKDSIEILGHRVDANGLHPLPDKLKAIDEALPPTSVEQLRSFLGLLTYYAKFLPNMATVLAPLYRLLHQDIPWRWTDEEARAFDQAKEALRDSPVLVHFEPDREIVLACDASPYGIGAVISHTYATADLKQMEDKPIAFASRSLTTAERNYSHLEKEALALVFGVTRFREYLLGRKFTLLTDHKPLVSIFSEDKPIPQMAAARIQRWALTLSAYDYRIKYRPGAENANADALSRFPSPIVDQAVPYPQEVILLLEQMDSTPITSIQIKEELSKDKLLSSVKNYVLSSDWPRTISEELQPYWVRRNELSIVAELLLWGNRVVVPEKLRPKVIEVLHHTHQGSTLMKRLARTMVWWPGIDGELVNMVRRCANCQENASAPPKAKPSAWPKPAGPWLRVHADYAGPLEGGKMLLIVVDAYSKWLEVCPVNTATAQITAEELSMIFARFGVPECLVTDNGTAFTGKALQSFLTRNGVRQLRTGPYHPQSNGLAERCVRIVKVGLKKNDKGTLRERLDRILTGYRRMPLADNKGSPAERLFGRQMRSHLDLLKPAASRSTSEVSVIPDKDQPLRFQTGDPVFVRNFGVGQKWVEGKVVASLGKRMVTVETTRGTERRHFDHIRKRSASKKDFINFEFFNIPTAKELITEDKHVLPTIRRSTRVKSIPKRLGS